MKKKRNRVASPEYRKVFCNKCNGDRRHELKYSHEGHDGDPEEYLEYWTDSLWVCCGCQSAKLLHHWELLGAEGQPGAPQPEDSEYPPRQPRAHRAKQFVNLPPPLAMLYRETVEALNGHSMVLCTIGLRALLDGVCRDKGLEKGNLEHKIEGLLKFIPNKSLISSLHGFRFAGNDAAHELKGAYPSEAESAIEVMEGLLNFLYELDYKAARIMHAGKNAKILKEQNAAPKAIPQDLKA